jgi:hypothetical protein
LPAAAWKPTALRQEWGWKQEPGLEGLVEQFLAAAFSQDERHLRRLGKVAALEAGSK